MNMEQIMEWELEGEINILEEISPRASFLITNSAWTDFASNHGYQGGKLVTSRLSYGKTPQYCGSSAFN
jgi:hypothetical protein